MDVLSFSMTFKSLKMGGKRGVVQGCTVYEAKDVKPRFSLLHPWLRKRYIPVALLAL
jgi:hypothetical protein